MEEKALSEKVAQVQAQQAQLQSALANAQRNGISNLAKAFVAAWGEIPAAVQRDAQNPHFGNDYATLEAVKKLVKPVLAKHGLAFLQTPGVIDGDKVEVLGVLIHESGERIELRMQMPLGGKATAQVVGSATTYACRYQLMAVFGIAPSDDDGEAASAPAPAPKKAKASPKKEDAAPSRGPAEEGGTYAEKKAQLLADIEAFNGNVDELSDDIKPRVEEFGDEDINAAYVAKRRALKGKK